MKEPTEVLKNKMIEVQNVLGDAIKDLESMIAKPTPSDEMGKLRFNKPSDANIAEALRTSKEVEDASADALAWAFGVYKQLVAFMEQETDQALGEFIDRSQRLEKNVEAKKELISQLIDQVNEARATRDQFREERGKAELDGACLQKKLESAKKNWEYFQKDRDLFHDKWVDEVEKRKLIEAKLDKAEERVRFLESGAWADQMIKLSVPWENKFLDGKEALEELMKLWKDRDYLKKQVDDLNGRLKIVDHDKDDLREEIIKIKAEGEVNVEKGRVYLKNQLANLIDERDRAWDLLAKRGTELKNLEACLKSAQDDRDEWKGSSLAYEKSLKHEIDLASEKIKELKECRETPPCTDHTWIRERIKGKLWEFCAPRLVE